MFQHSNKNFNFSEKICILSKMTYEHFLSEYKNQKGVDIPYCINARKRTQLEMTKVIVENRVDECFQKLVKNLFEKHDYKTLYKHGVLN